MTERERTEVNTGAPRVDEREVREDGGEHSGPRRVGEARRDRETDRGSGYASSDAHRDAERGTSWISVVLGWLAALGAGLILSGIVSGIVGPSSAPLDARGSRRAARRP